jgi:hypothetical protein
VSAPTSVDLVRSITVLTAQGKSGRQIADELGISRRTVNRWRAKHLPSREPLPTTWLRQAACKGADPAWFVPADDARTSYSRGRAVCICCPVRDACLTDALTREGDAEAADRAGLWGGLSPEQRANLAAVRDKRARRVRSRTEESQARHRDELLAALREPA